jgi:3-oxoacyl-[acyl-carrier-protein] synthase II
MSQAHPANRPEAVVITGLGTVGSFGSGADALAAALTAPSPRTTTVARLPGAHRDGGATLAALLPSSDLAPWVTAAAARRLSIPSRLALAAARMALADGGFAPLGGEPPAPRGPALGLAVGTAFGTAQFTEKLLREILNDPQSASPFLFTESVANAPAAQAAIALGAQGPNLTICQREASGLLAVAQAANQLRRGRAAWMLAGEVDESTPLLHAVLDRFGALAQPGAEGGELPRPFDRRRSGFLAAEGATMALLEPAGQATARGGRVLAQLLAAGAAFDPSAPPFAWGTGAEALAAGLRDVLQRSGVHPAGIDLVISGASGAVAGDRLEADVLRRVWDNHPLPPITAPKGVLGEYGGGLLAAAIAAVAGPVHPTAGFGEPDPALGIVPLAQGLPAGRRRILVSTIAAGGAAAWLVLAAPNAA